MEMKNLLPIVPKKLRFLLRVLEETKKGAYFFGKRRVGEFPTKREKRKTRGRRGKTWKIGPRGGERRGGRMEQTNYQIPSQTVAPFSPPFPPQFSSRRPSSQTFLFPGNIPSDDKSKGGERGGFIIHLCLYVCVFGRGGRTLWRWY